MALGSVPGYYTYGGSTYAHSGMPKVPAKARPPAAAPYGTGVPAPGWDAGLTTDYANQHIYPGAGLAGAMSQVENPGAMTGTAPPSGYLGELEGDPLWQQAQSGFENTSAAARDALRDSIRQLAIRSGFDLGGAMTGSLAQYAGDIDPATRDAAAQNPLSTRQQLADAFAGGQKNLAYALAGRGMLRSGGLVSGNTTLQRQEQSGTYNAMNQLLDAITGGVGSYNTAITDAWARRQAAQEAVASRLAQLFGPTYGDGTTGGTTPTAPGATTPMSSVPGAPVPYDPTRRLLPGQIAYA